MRARIKRVRHNAILPRYATRGAAGMDLHAAIDEPVTLRPMQAVYVRRDDDWAAISGVSLVYPEIVRIPTGIAIELSPGYEAQVRPRSGLALRYGVTVLNAPGTIDADYRGEIEVVLINLGEQAFRVEPGMRIAQLVIAPVVRVEWDEVDEFGSTERGAGGFGSTGV